MKLTSEQLLLVNSTASNRQLIAIHLAELGFSIFPLRPNSKIPADKGWQTIATSDCEKIRSWFAARPTMNYGIACGPSGLAVVDLDTKNGIDGISNWSRTTAGLGLQKTFEVTTPSGGMHLYFKAENVGNSVGTVAPGVDVRGTGGYVVGPGSTTDSGTYSSGLPWYFPEPGDFAEASEALVHLLMSRKGTERFESGGVLPAPGVPVSRHISKAQTENLGRNLLGLLNAGEGSRNATLNQSAFEIGSLVRDGVVSSEGAKSLLLKAAERIGLNSQEAKATIESGLEAGIEKADSVPGPSSKYQPLDIIAWLSEDHPDPETFGSGQILYQPGLIWVMGEPASGKSFLCLQWALDVMSIGKSVIWLDEEAGPRDTINKLKALGATENQLAKHFLYLQPEARNLSTEAEDLLAFVKATTPGLIVMDSAAAILANAGIDEDKNSPVVQFMNKAVLPLVKDLELPVLVIDHKTKNKSNTTYARGASSKLGIVDMALNVELKVGFSKSKSGSFEVKVNKDRSGIHAKDKCWLVKVQVVETGVELLVGDAQQALDTDKLSDDQLEILILEFIGENPGCSKAMIEKNVRGAGQTRKREVLKLLSESGAVSLIQKEGRNGFYATGGGLDA
jgi:archaellum biogenesis ATPase FlaH